MLCAYHGTSAQTYPDYADGTAGGVLRAIPGGGPYEVRAAPGRPLPPGDGRWTRAPAGEDPAGTRDGARGAEDSPGDAAGDVPAVPPQAAPEPVPETGLEAAPGAAETAPEPAPAGAPPQDPAPEPASQPAPGPTSSEE